MIFVFLDDRTLDVISDDPQALQNKCEPQNVESFKFYNSNGNQLVPRIWTEVEKDSFLFIPIRRHVMRFKLEQTEVNCIPEILAGLDELAWINQNQFFSSLEEVKAHFRKEKSL